MKDGASLDREKLSKALQAKRLTLTSMEQETITDPETAYAVTVIGGT